jgi:hypothetical protein
MAVAMANAINEPYAVMALGFDAAVANLAVAAVWGCHIQHKQQYLIGTSRWISLDRASKSKANHSTVVW